MNLKIGKILFNEKTSIEYLDLYCQISSTGYGNLPVIIKNLDEVIPSKTLNGTVYCLFLNMFNYFYDNRSCATAQTNIKNNLAASRITPNGITYANNILSFDTKDLIASNKINSVNKAVGIRRTSLNGSTNWNGSSFSESFITFYSSNKSNSFHFDNLTEITFGEPIYSKSPSYWNSICFDGGLCKLNKKKQEWELIFGNFPTYNCAGLLFSILEPKPKRILWKD